MANLHFPSNHSFNQNQEGEMFKLAFGLIFAAAAALLLAPVASAGEAEVVLLDECDPTTFDAALGAGVCVNVSAGGPTVNFNDFLAALPTGHAAWLFHTTDLASKKQDTIRATNQGGEIHTFTEVAQFGNGFVPALNNPTGSTNAIPECTGGFVSNPDVAATRVAQGSSRVVTRLRKGIHRFQCCVHPWMRSSMFSDVANS